LLGKLDFSNNSSSDQLSTTNQQQYHLHAPLIIHPSRSARPRQRKERKKQIKGNEMKKERQLSDFFLPAQLLKIYTFFSFISFFPCFFFFSPANMIRCWQG